MTDPDLVMSAAERDHADALAMQAAHWRELFGSCTGDGCRECASYADHVQRTAEQIDLLRVPGETGELF